MLSNQQLLERLLGELDSDERAHGVAYYADRPLAKGAKVPAPGIDATAPFDALVGFVDRDPTANWGHSCRYLLLNRETGEVMSIEAQLPPFGPVAEQQWRVAYKSPSVPDAAVAVSS